MTEAERAALSKYVAEIGGTMAAISETPEELIPYSAFIPDSGYCVFVIPEVLKDEEERQMFATSVPIPVLYVIEKGWRMANGRVYCDVPYDDDMGAIAPEVYCVYERQPERKTGFYAIEKGKVFPPVAGHPDGVYFVRDLSGAMIIVNFSEPDADETEQMQAGKALRLALFKDDGLMSVLVKFGTMEWMECPYNPAIENRDIQAAIRNGNMTSLTTFMTDSPSGEVVSKVRLVGLPEKFAMELRKAMIETLDNPVTGMAYTLRLANQRARYSVDDMVRDAVLVVDI